MRTAVLVAVVMDRVPKRMMLTNLKTLTPLLLVLGMLAFGGGMSVRRAAAAQPNPPKLLAPNDAKKTADESDKMFPDGRDYNFGKVKSGTPVKHAFRIVNMYKVPLQINSVRTSMNPLTAQVTKVVLQPNEEGKLQIVVDTRRFHGSKTMGLYLTTEHGATTQEFRFTISGISQEQP